MAKKQLSAQEQKWTNLVPEITQKTDPLEKLIAPQEKAYDKVYNVYEGIENELENLQEVAKPKEPTANAGDVAKGCFGVTAGLVVLLFLFHCVIWVLKFVFDITWNTWAWTTNTLYWGVGISVVATAIAFYLDHKAEQEYEEKEELYNEYVAEHTRLTKEKNKLVDKLNTMLVPLNKLYDEQRNILKFAVNNMLGIPCPKEAITSETYQGIKARYLLLKDMKEEIEKKRSEGKNIMALERMYLDKKLQFIYEESIKAQVSEDVYKEFEKVQRQARTNTMLLREDFSTGKSKGLQLSNELPRLEKLLKKDGMTPIINRFEAVANRDTNKSGFLSFLEDSDKKAAQTQDMQRLAQSAKQEYDAMMDTNTKVLYALDFVRACAFRNIYLGAELVTYIKNVTGGGSLTVQQDNIAMQNMQMTGLDMDVTNINVDVSGAAFNTLNTIGNALNNDKNLLKLAKDNPKMALGVTAVAAIGSAVVTYFDNLNKNANAQKEMIDAINAISEGYTEGRASMLRAIEIMEGIVKCNEGFMAIYTPLKKQVFEDGNLNIDKNDIVQLADAINKYKKVTDAKIK